MQQSAPMFRWLSIVILFTALGRADADPERAFELGARLGFQSTSLNFSDDAAQGIGPWVDVSAGTYFKPWLTASLCGAYSSIHDTVEDPFSTKTHEDTVRFVDVGARVLLRHRSVLAGLGLAWQNVFTSGGNGSFHDSGRLTTLHVGYTFARMHALGGGAIQVMGIAGTATTPGGHSITTLRLGAGIEF